MATLEVDQGLRITFDDIAKKLLQEKFLLTSLELHSELVEAGHELPRLRDYFSSPANFELCSKSLLDSSLNLNRSLSQTTLDSLDWARYSEDGERTSDDKVAVLEFELRKAKETISGLRNTLTEVTVSKEEDQEDNVNGASRKSSFQGTDELKPHQVSTLNFLINEYLVSRGYKMTAITFADENDNQDFDNWDDVGLNIPRPPSLMQWWQGKGPKFNPTCSTEIQTDPLEPEPSVDMSQLDELSTEIETLKAICLKQDEELSSLRRRSSTPQVTPFGTPFKTDHPEPFSMKGVEVETEYVPSHDDFQPISYTDQEVQSPFSDNVNELIEDAIIPTSLEKPAHEEAGSPFKVPANEPICIHQTNPFEDTDLVDPQNCDRLSPLGASEEWVPHGTLSGGEFVSAQRKEAKHLLEASFDRQIPLYLGNLVLNGCFGQTLEVDSRLQKEVASLSVDNCSLLSLVSTSLPNIAPNVLLAKREELLPLLVYSIINHQDESRREKLLHLLFNLTKKPDKSQRQTILLGLVCLARVLNPKRLEAEVLPQCWEQLTHKYPERRLLVAQSVGVLAPYTPPHIRNSLLLSMIQQILGGDEKDPEIIDAATASLALLVAYLDDKDKISPLIETLLTCIENEPNLDFKSLNQDVLTSQMTFYMALAQICLDLGELEQFLLRQAAKIYFLIKNFVQEMQLQRKSKSDILRKVILSSVMYFNAAWPYILAMLIKSMPSTEVETSPFLPNSQVSQVIDQMRMVLPEHDVEKDFQSLHLSTTRTVLWSQLEFIVEELLPKLVDQLSLLESTANQIIRAYVALFSKMCVCLGPTVKDKYIKPLFTQYFGSDQSTSHSHLTKSPIIVYVASVLSENTGSDCVSSFLTEQICLAAKHQYPTSSIELAITLLLERETHEEAILTSLWACVVDRSPVVRIYSAPLWALLIGHVKESDLASRVVPALVTIATDSDPAVKSSALNPLTTVLQRASNKEVCDKVKLQLECICEEKLVVECPELQVEIAKTCSALGLSTPPNILHNIFLPCLCRSVLEGIGTAEQKSKLGMCVLEAFAALVSAAIPNHIVAHFILPTLNDLQKTLGSVSFDNMETITSLTKEFTMRAQANASNDRPRTITQSNSIASGMAAMSSNISRQGVEDVKNTMSKIGRAMSSGVQGKASTINLPNLFKRKQ